MTSLRIGQLARSAGVGIETIRFYERKGLIKEPPRRESGYRQYPPAAVSRLRFIRRAKVLGFTLKQIRELLDLKTDSDQQCGEVREQLAARIVDVESRIADLERMKTALEELHAACDTINPWGDCPILEILEREEKLETMS